MAGKTYAGPICQILQRPNWLEDGTICRCESHTPGPVGEELRYGAEPRYIDHFSLGPNHFQRNPMGQESWFERRYPNLMEEARLKFVDTINRWVQDNWSRSAFTAKSPRISVHGRNKYESPTNANHIWIDREWRDNRFEKCGDEPQSGWPEADMLVGSFAIDFETPVNITYMRKNVRGKMVDAFEWTAVMYVEDTLGAQPHDPLARNFPRIAPYAPSRTVKRATWKIHGEGVKEDVKVVDPWRTHRIVPGDTLSGLAQKYYKDAKLWPILYKINRDNIGINPSMLRVGAVLEIPDLNQLSAGLKEAAMASAPSAIPAPNTIFVAPDR